MSAPTGPASSGSRRIGRRSPAGRDRRRRVMVLWAGNFIVVKSAVAVLPPVGFTFLRFVLATVTLLVLLRLREGSIGLPRRDLVAIMGFGALGFGVYQILWTTGLTTSPAGDSALFIAATPVLVALLAVVARTDVLTPTKLAGVLVSFVGVADRHRLRARADAGRLDRRRGDHARRRVLLGDLHGVRRAVPAAPLAAPGDGLGDRSRGPLVLAPLAILQLRSVDVARARAGGRARDPVLGLPRGRRLERPRHATGSRSSARPGRRPSSSSSRRSRSSWPPSSCPSRSGRARSSVASSSSPGSPSRGCARSSLKDRVDRTH